MNYWTEYDSRYDVYVKHDPNIYENLEYKIPEIDNNVCNKPFDFIKIINNLLKDNDKQIMASIYIWTCCS